MTLLSANRMSLITLILTFMFVLVCVVPCVPAASLSLVPQGAVWKYSTGSDLGTAWRESLFDDSNWTSGQAQLGYGDGDETTLIPSSPAQPCYYFRTGFTVNGDPTSFSSLNLEVLRDDGCVVYLNGQEVARYGMPVGPIAYSTWASTATDYQWDPPLSIPNLLLPGANVIAVEVHQCNATSTDISLDLRLTGTTEINVVLNSPTDDQTEVRQPAILSATAAAPAGGNLNVKFYGRLAGPPLPDFTLAVLPDTQYYTSELNGGQKAIFISQTEWIVANQASLNIAYVAHMGDVTDSGDKDTDESEWQNAQAAVSRFESPLASLPNGIPYGLAVGNHDQMILPGDVEPTTLYNKYFGVSRFAGRSYYGGNFDGRNNNQYHLFSASGFDFVVVYLEYSPGSAVLTWADQVLRANPLRRAIIVSHSLLETPSGAWTIPGLAIYNSLKGNPNLFLMLCGHNDGEVRRIDTYNGSTVHTLLADFQFKAGGGNGFMRLLTFSANDGEIRVSTYSPWLRQFETDTNSQFSVPWPVATTSAFTVVQETSGVASGAETIATWRDLQPGAAYQWYVTADDGAETATSEIRRFTVALNNPPTVTLTSPADGAVCPPGAITLTAAAGDSDGTIVSVAFYDGTSMLGFTDGSPFTVENAAPGDHSFTVVATDDGGAATVSAPARVFVGSAPLAPADLQATAISPTEITLAWTDASDFETGFEVSESGTTLSSLAANTTWVTVSSLAPATTYHFSVLSFNPAGRSESATLTVTTLAPPPPPAAPANFQAVPVSRTAIQLTWVDQSSSETAFLVERSLDGIDWFAVQTTAANVSGWQDTAVVSGTVYYYRVAAVNAGGSSAHTPMVAAAPLIESYPTFETTTLGIIAGSRADTQVADGQYETVTEQVTGKKGVRISALEHTWTLDVTPGKSVVFWLKSYRSASPDNDAFVFAWSTDKVTYVPIQISITATPEAGYQSYALPNSLQGPVYVRVQDTDRVSGNTALDSVYIDYMAIITDASPPSEPPSAPILNPIAPGDGTAGLSWAPVSGAITYSVWREAADGWHAIARLAETGFTDSGLANGTTYSYYVMAENAFGQSAPSAAQSCTPRAIVVPEPPAALRASAAKGKINLVWVQSATSGVTQNRIYRAENGGAFMLRATISAAAAYTDSGVISGARYSYYVTALIETVESAGSNTATVTAR